MTKENLTLATIAISLTSLCSAANYSFESGTFAGWATIGNVSLVNSSYGYQPEGETAALLTTGAGAVPMNDLLDFIEANGVKGLDSLRSLGGVGSAMVTTSTSYQSGYIPYVAFTNDPSKVNSGAGGYAGSGRASDGLGGAGALFLGAQVLPSQTPFAYESGQINYTGYDSEVGLWKNFIMVYSTQPDNPDFQFAVMVDNFGEPGRVPEAANTALMMFLSFFGLAAVRRLFA